LYAEDEGSRELFAKCSRHPKGDLFIREGFLFKGTRLCVARCSTRELLIREVHGVSLASHYDENKTPVMLRELYY